MGGIAGPEAQRRVLVGALVVAALLTAIGLMTAASHDRTTQAGAEAPRATTSTEARSTTTVAPTTTDAAPSTTSAATPSTATSSRAHATPTTVAVAADDGAGSPSLPTGDGTPTGPPPPPKGDCGGQRIMKPEGVPWVCTFDDEFNGSSVDTSLWRIQETSWNGFHSGPECFVDSPNNVSVSDGALHLTVRKEAQGFTCQRPRDPYNTQYTAGMVTTYGKFTQAWGRYEIRAKFPNTSVKGVQSSFWLWPENPRKYGDVWPNSGEIDMAEYYSQWPTRVIPYVHYTGSTYKVTNNNCVVPDPSQWHTYLMVWTKEFIDVTIDGADCLSTQPNPVLPMKAPAPFDQPFMISLTQALGIRSNAFLPDATPLPATTTVDFVRIWK